jgi:nitroreductase
VITKEKMLDAAELIDAYRIFVRMIMVAYATGYAWLVYAIWDWFKSVPDPTNTQTAFATGLLTAVGAMLTFLTNTYVKTGRHWNGQ